MVPGFRNRLGFIVRVRRGNRLGFVRVGAIRRRADAARAMARIVMGIQLGGIAGTAAFEEVD